jgi:putative transposase
LWPTASCLNISIFSSASRSEGVEKIRYIHRNSVRPGLVDSPEQWRWSSFRAYDYGEAGPVRVNDWSVLKLKVRVAS